MWTYVWIFIGVFLFYKLIKYGSFINIEYPIENFSIGRGGNLGLFNGFIKLEDIGGTKLVVVYHANDGKRFGYTHRKILDLHRYIIHEGGQVNIHGEINKSDEGYFYGKVFIEYDPNLIN